MVGKLKWDEVGTRLYETGTRRGVLFPKATDGKNAAGVAWSGLTAVKQAPDGAEATPIYADNIIYGMLQSVEKFKGTIEAFMYPDEFAECDGSHQAAKGIFVGQQQRKPFDMTYETRVISDTNPEHGRKIHFIYNARVTPSSRDYATINESPEATPFSWSFDTTPVDPDIPGIQPTAYIYVDSSIVGAEVFKKIEDLIYGTEEKAPTMPTLKELIALIGE